MWDELLSSGRADGILLHNNPIYIIPQRKGIVKWENGDSLYFVEKYMGELHKNGKSWFFMKIYDYMGIVY
jgi:hypothetical protein